MNQSISSDEADSRQVLNLGCGQKRDETAVNLDITSDTNPDVVHDLNELPWPFAADRFRSVKMLDVIEHLDNIVSVMNELHRVCRHGARITITTPHFSSSNSFTDPTHRHHLGWFSMDYFTGEHEHSYYTQARFRTIQRSLIFKPSLLNRIIRRMASRWPGWYESRWAWMFPAWFLYFELEVVKE